MVLTTENKKFQQDIDKKTLSILLGTGHKRQQTAH
jgi:hypothetical protein